ncbi:Ig-like domain-containing protein [Spirosoma litoris]
MTLPVRLAVLLTGLLIYCQLVQAQITITSVTPTSACAGSTVTVTYNSLQSGTLYTYLYSANSTDFGSPKQLQTISGGNNLTVTIPLATTQASGSYTIRLTLNTPSSTSYTSTSLVTVNSAPIAPTINSAVSYCQWTTSSPLAATASAGGTLNWYGTASGGIASSTPTIPSTSIVGITNYYVSQTVNGCEGPRASISVIVRPIPTTPTPISNAISLCQGSIAPVLSVIANSGGVLNWYTTSVGGTASLIAPIPPTSTPGTFSYYVSQTVNGCEGPRASISVIVNPLPIAPSVSSVTYCQGSQASPLIATKSTGGILNWYGASASGGTASSIAPIPPTSTLGAFNYYVSQTINFCEGPRAAINVTIMPKPTVSIDAGEAILTPSQTSLALTATSSTSTLSWSTGETMPTITINTAGVYSVTATAVNGCSSIATITISQSSRDVIYSIKPGGWNDPTIWSTNQIPTSADAVRLRHAVNLPIDYQAQAGLLSYDAGGQLNTDMGSRVRLGTDH